MLASLLSAYSFEWLPRQTFVGIALRLPTLGSCVVLITTFIADSASSLRKIVAWTLFGRLAYGAVLRRCHGDTL